VNWPTSQDYNEAVQDPSISFSDPGLQGGEVVCNAMGLPVPRSGNFADVYQFTAADGKMWALKCFTRKVPGLRERYAKIDEHLAKARLPFTVGFKFLQQGVKIRGEWYPLLKMEWVEGLTLNDFVSQNLGKPHHLHALMQMWAKLTGRLRDAGMAHADLQHGNVLLVPGATPQKLGLKLIDYDGMWVPALAEHHSGEVGHPNFQHPMRLKEKLYTGEVDRFPHLVIAAGLRAALIGGQALWDKFDNGDNLLFKETDFRDPGKAPVFKALWELNDPVLRTLVGHIALSTKQPLRKTPWLDDVLFEQSGPKLTADQERQVCELLGVATAAPTGTAATPPLPVEREFNVFQFLDEDEGPVVESARSGRRPIAKRKPPKKSNAPLFIAGGMGALVLLVGGVVAAMNLGKKDRPTETVQTTEGGGSGTPKTGPNVPVPVANDVTTKDELREALADTKWDWGDGTLELRADGTAYHKAWVERFHLTKRWEAVDRRTVLMVVEAGRELNRYGILEFSEDLSQFTGFDFGYMQRMPDKKRIGPLARTDFRPAPGTPTQDAKQELHRLLAGSRWQWTGGVLTLKDDGSVGFPRSAGNLLAKWEPIDRRTVLVRIEQGKPHDRMALLQISEDGRELTGYDFEHAARVPPRKRLNAGPVPPPVGSPNSPVMGIAVVAGGHDFLFIRKDDPALYASVNGSARKPHEVGRAASSLRTIAVTPDGSKAVTGAEDGEVRVWTLKGAAPERPPAGGGVAMKTPITNYKKVEAFKGRFSIDVFEEGVVVHDHETDRDATIPVGEPGRPLKGAFQANVSANPKLAERLGRAETDEIHLFNEALIVQVFEGGIQLYTRTGNKSWFATHARRKGTTDGGPGEAGAPFRPMKEHAGPILACAVSPEGTRAVTIGQDRLLCEWDLAGAKLILKFQVPDSRTVAYTPDGKSVLLGTEKDSAAIWDLETKARSKPLPGHMDPVRGMCVSPRGDMAWTAGENGDIRAWNVPEFQSLTKFSNEQKAVSALAVSADGEVLAAAGPDGWVRYFKAKTGAPLGGGGGQMPIYAVAFLPDGHRLVAAWGPEPVVADVQGGPPSPATGPAVLKLLEEAAGPAAQVQKMGYRADGKYLWLATPNSVTVVDGPTGREVKSWAVEGVVAHAAFGPGKELYVALTNGRFEAWDWEKGQRTHEHEPGQLLGRLSTFWPTSVANRLLVTNKTPSIQLWDTVKWKEAERLTPYPGEPILDAAPYPGGGRFAAIIGARDGLRIIVWDAVDRREVIRLDGADLKTAHRLDVSPGGRWIVGLTRDGGGQAIVWDGRTGKHAHTIPGLRPGNIGGGFSPGGDHYIACELGGRRLDINLVEGKLADESRGQRPSFVAAAAPAVGQFATADVDRKVRIWRFDVDTKPVEMARLPDPKAPSPMMEAPVKEGFIKDSAELPDELIGCVVSSDGKKVFAATKKGVVHVLDAATGSETDKYEVTKARLIHMVLLPKYSQTGSGVTIPDRLHILDDDRHLHTWDTEKKSRVREINLEKTLPAVAPETKIVVTSNETHVLVFDPVADKAYAWIVGRWTVGIPPALQRPEFNNDTRVAAFSADGSLGAAHARNKLLVWRPKAGKDFNPINSGGAQWIGLSPDAGVVVTTDGGLLRAWKYETGTKAFPDVLSPHGFRGKFFAAVTGFALVTVGGDQSFRVWDLRTGKESTRWNMDRTPIGVAVSADGRTAAVWYEDGNKVGLWALPDPKKKPG
jgi:WD40 repeat protein